MIHRKITAGVLAGAVALLAGLGGGMVQAAPRSHQSPSVDPLPVVQNTTTTLPIMGVQLVINVTTNPGGNIATATISPANPGDYTATVSPNRVSFVNTAGTVKVSVKSRGNTQSISARAGSLKDISGDGHWTGDVFGIDPATDTLTTVDYTVGPDPATPGGPLVTITKTTDATAVILPAVQSTDDEGGMSSRAKVTFSLNGQSRTLTISATVRTFTPEADDEHSNAIVDPAAAVTPVAPVTVAALRITLSGFKGVPQDLAKLVAAGPQTWKGFLCDGTKASITYSVDLSGKLTLAPTDPVLPATGEVKSSGGDEEHGTLDVRWSKNERVRIQAHSDGTNITINVRDRFRCSGASDPTIVGASVVPNSGDHHGEGDHTGGGDHNGGKGGSGGGDD